MVGNRSGGSDLPIQRTRKAEPVALKSRPPRISGDAALGETSWQKSARMRLERLRFPEHQKCRIGLARQRTVHP